MAASVSHNFKLCDNEKETEFNKKCVIVVGSTGVGKSSLIRLFCGDKVKVGHGTESKTQDSILFNEKNVDRHWLDSQGANDSEEIEDDKILTDILKQLYNGKIGNIHIIWCIDDGRVCRAKGELKKQARFIKILGNNSWESCLIVKKGGCTKPEHVDGVLAAAKEYGSDIQIGDNQLFGFTGLEYPGIKNDKHYKDWMEDFGDNSTKLNQKFLKFGYLKNIQITQQINKKLSDLPSLKIKFTTSKCLKCGIKGDQRLLYAPCHTKKEKYHPLLTVPFHSGSIKQFHVGSLQHYHSGNPQVHDHYEWYHPGDWDDHVARNVSLHFLTLGIHSIARAATDTMGDWTCCGSSSSSGCKQRKSSSTCSYSCCGGSPSSSGCQSKFGCCNGASNSAGCRKEYGCCNAPQSNTGCRRKHKCCKQNLGTNGCKDRCQSCHKAWGSSVGCTKTTQNI